MKKILASVAVSALAVQMTLADQISSTAVVVAEETSSCDSSFDGIFVGLGVGGSFLKNKGDIKRQNINRFMGTFLIGGGKVFSDTLYVGVDGLIDVTKSKTHSATKDDESIGEVKNKGFLPSIGIRLGFVKSDWNSVFYARIAGTRTNVSFHRAEPAERIGSSHRISPTFAFGFEKMFSNRVSGRLELEYKRPTTKTVADVKYKSNGGFNLRALAVYNVKI